MISEKTRQLEEKLRAQYVPYPDYRNIDWVPLRQAMDQDALDRPIPDGIVISETQLGDIPVERINLDTGADKYIFHVHGGGMTLGSKVTGRPMLSHLALYSRRNTISVDYRLCPEYSQLCAIEDCITAYQALLAEGVDPANIAFLGESAGGMLIMSMLGYISEHNLPMPGCACAISCSVDPYYNSDSMRTCAETEIVVNLNLRDQMSDFYYQNADLNDPAFNPYGADVTGWPPVYFHACDNEILRDESVRMYEKLQAAGIPTRLTLKSDLFHCYMLYDIPESDEAYREIAAFFNEY